MLTVPFVLCVSLPVIVAVMAYAVAMMPNIDRAANGTALVFFGPSWLCFFGCDTRVFSGIYQLQVLNAIVCLVAIDVMHVFVSGQASPYVLFHNKAMHVYPFAVWRQNPDIAAVKPSAAFPENACISALEIVSAFLATKCVIATLEIGWKQNKFLPTLLAVCRYRALAGFSESFTHKSIVSFSGRNGN